MRLPHSFGRYVLTKKLATGGMAEIYRAKYVGEGGFERKVAIKRLLPAWSADKDFITMLIDEAKALVHLQHKNIVQVLELGKEEESFFISMELIEGLDLGALLNRLIRDEIALPLKYCLYIICQILEALDFAHRQVGEDGKLLHIVHRDVSPPNVLLSWNGEVKVADFGIAKGEHRTYETQVAQVKGKYSYMSPEQASGQVVDRRTDIYAAGILLYELLTLKKLFDAPNDLEVIELVKHSLVPSEPISIFDPQLRKILLKTLCRERGERYQTAGEFLEALNQFTLKKGLSTSSFEFAQFLQTTFPNEAQRHEEEVEYEKNITAARPATRPFGKFTSVSLRLKNLNVALRGATVAALAGCIILPWGPALNTLNASAKTETKIETPEVRPVEVKADTQAASPAMINVNARPWGYVTIPGYTSNKETPVRNLKVKPGPQLVKIFYEPENRWLSAKVDAKSGETTNCFAQFGAHPQLQCK